MKCFRRWPVANSHPPRFCSIGAAVFGLCFVAFNVLASSTGDGDGASQPPKKEGISGEYESTLKYVGDNGRTPVEFALGEDDNRASVLQQLMLSVKRGDTDGGATLQLRMFPASPAYWPIDNISMYRFGNDVRIERFWYHHKAQSIEVTFGDFSLTLGRKLAFYVDGDATGWDQATLRGASLEFAQPGRFLLGLYGGSTNTQNTDPVTGSMLEAEAADTVVAVQVQWHAKEVVRFGMHGVHFEPRYKLATDIPQQQLWVDKGPGIRISTAGALLDFRLGGISFYAEGNFQSHDNFRTISSEGVHNESGSAVYAELAWDSGPYFRRIKLQLQTEGVWYRRFLAEGTYRSAFGEYLLSELDPAVKYHQMPTLEPDWVLIRSLGNELGGRVTGNVLFKRTETSVEVATSYIHYLGGIGPVGRWDRFKGVEAFHGVVSLSQPFCSSRETKLVLEAGGRYEQTDAPTSGYAENGYLYHGKMSLFIRASARHGFGFSTLLRRHKLGVMQQNGDFRVSDSELEYRWMSQWRFVVRLQYSDELQGAEKQRLILGRQVSWSPDWFVNGTVTWSGRGMWAPLSASLSGGTVRGGFVCEHGSCRMFPDATEAMLSVRYYR
ncbi:MAG: hypothetical protein JXR76_32225 [Deltaproteobacteria bacterium]|nr:hypothetical protein [Deltaproteobacteria bacterium]